MCYPNIVMQMAQDRRRFSLEHDTKAVTSVSLLLNCSKIFNYSFAHVLIYSSIGYIDIITIAKQFD